MSQIARVFPRKTKASPEDNLAFFDVNPPLLALPEISEVHVSVAFSWDLPQAERLAEAWRAVGVPVKMGGPALHAPGGDFIPGRYLRQGYVITSRGCPNRCWFCDVPKREGYALRELPITNGWNVLDDNLLACSEGHIRAVFQMLRTQPNKAEFTGGLEARMLKPWHAALLREIKAKRMYFAYDTPDDYEPLVQAGNILRQEGHKVSRHSMCCYVLIGYGSDTFAAAQERLENTIRAGFVPYAMLYRDRRGEYEVEWRRFQRVWSRPAIVGAKMREILRAEVEPCLTEK